MQIIVILYLYYVQIRCECKDLIDNTFKSRLKEGDLHLTYFYNQKYY